MAKLVGCDFSSRPSRGKPIVLAHGHRNGARVTLERLQRYESLDAFAAWLAEPGDWIGGFDLPFGLPRELVRSLGWPLEWATCMRHYAALSRAQIRTCFKSFCDARPAGSKFAHRATDRPAGSSPSMKWVNPPVAYMLHAGVPLLIGAGVHLPGLQHQDGLAGRMDQPARIALEAYPGLLAREVLGRQSYKSDDRAKQTPERRLRREQLVSGLNSIPGVNCLSPDGGIFCFPNISSLAMSDVDFSTYILEEAKVSSLPGSAFGPGGDGHLRMNFARRNAEDIDEAVERIRRALMKL